MNWDKRRTERREWPRMNTDQHKNVLSVFIRVHPWPAFFGGLCATPQTAESPPHSVSNMREYSPEAYRSNRKFAGGRLSCGSDSIDRKSTRLNSSHLGISYAAFCFEQNSTRLNSTHIMTRSDFFLLYHSM